MAEQEFRRTCQKCGKVWHSLVSRENTITKNQAMYKKQLCFQMCNADAQAQHARNKDNAESELDRLQKCPECGSKDYKEEIV